MEKMYGHADHNSTMTLRHYGGVIHFDMGYLN